MGTPASGFASPWPVGAAASPMKDVADPCRMQLDFVEMAKREATASPTSRAHEAVVRPAEDVAQAFSDLHAELHSDGGGHPDRPSENKV